MLTRLRAPLQLGNTPLHVAASNGHDGMVKELLEKGANHSAKAKVSGERERASGVLRGGGSSGIHTGIGRGEGLAERC